MEFTKPPPPRSSPTLIVIVIILISSGSWPLHSCGSLAPHDSTQHYGALGICNTPSRDTTMANTDVLSSSHQVTITSVDLRQGRMPYPHLSFSRPRTSKWTTKSTNKQDANPKALVALGDGGARAGCDTTTIHVDWKNVRRQGDGVCDGWKANGT